MPRKSAPKTAGAAGKDEKDMEKKHEDFIEEEVGEKEVTAVPGIGKPRRGKDGFMEGGKFGIALKKKGYKAKDLVELFRESGCHEVKFKGKIKEMFPEVLIQFKRLIPALQDYCEIYGEAPSGHSITSRSAAPVRKAEVRSKSDNYSATGMGPVGYAQKQLKKSPKSETMESGRHGLLMPDKGMRKSEHVRSWVLKNEEPWSDEDSSSVHYDQVAESDGDSSFFDSVSRASNHGGRATRRYDQNRSQAYEEGRSRGYDPNRSQTYEERRSHGYDQNRGQAYEESRSRGFDQNRSQGYEEGRSRGYDPNTGHNYEESQAHGYRQRRDRYPEENYTHSYDLSRSRYRKENPTSRYNPSRSLEHDARQRRDHDPGRSYNHDERRTCDYDTSGSSYHERSQNCHPSESYKTKDSRTRDHDPRSTRYDDENRNRVYESSRTSNQHGNLPSGLGYSRTREHDERGTDDCGTNITLKHEKTKSSDYDSSRTRNHDKSQTHGYDSTRSSYREERGTHNYESSRSHYDDENQALVNEPKKTSNHHGNLSSDLEHSRNRSRDETQPRGNPSSRSLVHDKNHTRDLARATYSGVSNTSVYQRRIGCSDRNDQASSEVIYESVSPPSPQGRVSRREPGGIRSAPIGAQAMSESESGLTKPSKTNSLGVAPPRNISKMIRNTVAGLPLMQKHSLDQL